MTSVFALGLPADSVCSPLHQLNTLQFWPFSQNSDPKPPQACPLVLHNILAKCSPFIYPAWPSSHKDTGSSSGSFSCLNMGGTQARDSFSLNSNNISHSSLVNDTGESCSPSKKSSSLFLARGKAECWGILSSGVSKSSP